MALSYLSCLESICDTMDDLFKEKLDRLKELYRNLKDPARLRAIYEAHRLKHLQAKVCKGLRQKLAQHRQFHFPPDRNRMTYPGVYSGDDCCSGMVRRAKGTTCKNGYDYYNPLLNGSVDISDLEAKGPSPWKLIRLE